MLSSILQTPTLATQFGREQIQIAECQPSLTQTSKQVKLFFMNFCSKFWKIWVTSLCITLTDSNIEISKFLEYLSYMISMKGISNIFRILKFKKKFQLTIKSWNLQVFQNDETIFVLNIYSMSLLFTFWI